VPMMGMTDIRVSVETERLGAGPRIAGSQDKLVEEPAQESDGDGTTQSLAAPMMVTMDIGALVETEPLGGGVGLGVVDLQNALMEEAEKRLLDTTSEGRDSLKSVLDGAQFQILDIKPEVKSQKKAADEDDENDGKGSKKFVEMTPEEKDTLRSKYSAMQVKFRLTISRTRRTGASVICEDTKGHLLSYPTLHPRESRISTSGCNDIARTRNARTRDKPWQHYMHIPPTSPWLQPT
jgi:hypothetical protein